MSKSIWILNHHATNMFFDKGGRHYYFAKYLINAGYDVKIFCASTVHNSDKNLIQDGRLYFEDDCDGTPFVFIKTRNYNGSGKKRILNMFDYYRNVKKAAVQFPKPDIILGSSVHPLACLAAIQLSKKLGCKNIVEIRDLWPESFVAYNVVGGGNPLLKILYAGEKWIYKKADRLIFTVAGGKEYIIEKGWDTEHGGSVDLHKVYHINNGVDLALFQQNQKDYTFADEDLDNSDKFNIVYTGSVRRVNNIGLVLDIAKQLKDEDVRFLIWGDGNELEDLKKRVEDENISNVVFKGRIGKEYVPYILSKSDLNLIHVQATPIMRFGCSLNKLFEYLASRRPVLSDLKVNYDVIKEYNAGIVTENQNVDEIAEIVCSFKNMPREQYEEMCANAWNAAQNYDFRKLTDDLKEIIEGC